MRKAMAPALAAVLVLAAASSALAARPDVFREHTSGSEYDDSVSGLCGFDVWLDYRADVLFRDGFSFVHAERFRTGPGGSITQVVHYTFVPSTFEIIGDPESGSWTEILRELLHGSRVWSSPGDGVIYRDAGYFDGVITITITPEGETVELTDEGAHGQQPGQLSEEEMDELLCATLG